MSPLVVSVHQPNFMPWLKLLDKILASDVYVAYDTVQYTKSEYHSRQKVKQQSGPVWMSVPVVSVRGAYQVIEDVRIDDRQPFRQQHLSLLRKAYGRAPHFDEVYPLVRDVYARGHELLADLNVDLIEAFCRYLGSAVRIVRASSLPHEGDNTARLVQLVRETGGDVHLTSTFDTQRQYIDWSRMQAAGISVHKQVFEHPSYDQLWGDFFSHLSALDMLFCCGRQTGKVLEADRQCVEAAAAETGSAAGGVDSQSRTSVGRG